MTPIWKTTLDLAAQGLGDRDVVAPIFARAKAMFVERRVLPNSEKVEIWECEWENPPGMQARKRFIRKIGTEQPLMPDTRSASLQHAICWSYGRTLANIAVFSPDMLGHFPSATGSDATLPCDFVNAGKFRHGAARWWCRTHQTHWGTKADQQSYARSRVMVCANHEQVMNYVVKPFELNVDDYDEVTVSCSLPAALSTTEIQRRPPTIRVDLGVRSRKRSKSTEHAAISLVYQRRLELFATRDIERVNITPPAALEFVLALDAERALTCIACSHCSYPHLDLGDFARKPHRKHFCANCGRDSTWSKSPIISTPLKPIYDQLCGSSTFTTSRRSINLDEYPGCDYSIWPSIPAALWISSRPQTVGIRVLLARGGEVVEDDIFGEVQLAGSRLDRGELLRLVLERTIN